MMNIQESFDKIKECDVIIASSRVPRSLKPMFIKAKIRRSGSKNWIDLEEYNKPEEQNFEEWQEE